MEQLLRQGIAKNLIALSEDGKTITYLHPNKRRNYTNPEEQVQAEIANHISQIRAQAKTLQHQTAAELEQAKQQVEIMILGD